MASASGRTARPERRSAYEAQTMRSPDRVGEERRKRSVAPLAKRAAKAMTLRKAVAHNEKPKCQGFQRSRGIQLSSPNILAFSTCFTELSSGFTETKQTRRQI